MKYANYVNVGLGESEVVLDFRFKVGRKTEPVERLVMSKETAVKLLGVLGLMFPPEDQQAEESGQPARKGRKKAGRAVDNPEPTH